MTDEYTPTTAEVRRVYGDAECPDANGSHDNGCPADLTFDRWLAQVKADALQEASQIAYDLDSYEVGAAIEVRAAELRSGAAPVTPQVTSDPEPTDDLLVDAVGVMAFQGYGSEKGIEVFKRMFTTLSVSNALASRPSVEGEADNRVRRECPHGYEHHCLLCRDENPVEPFPSTPPVDDTEWEYREWGGLVRRRKAGPWLPVDDSTKGEEK